jgi:hypothetical protein
LPYQEGGARQSAASSKKRAEVDEDDWVREPGSVGWVREEEAAGSGWSLADTDYECIHGRLCGDVCPQPATVPGYKNKPIPNPSRFWDKPYPCDCWGEATVKTTPTPDPFAPARTPTQGGPWSASRHR